MDSKTASETPVPVPKPRRHTANTDANLKNHKIAYENVSIDLINKQINIKDENIQNNTKNKLQTNKLFLMPNTSMTSNNNNDITSSTQILTNLNDLANAPVKHQKNLTIQLDEVNKLSNIYNDDENVNVKPVPAPRRSNAINDNVKQFNCDPSTGAIKKQPTTIDINDFIESPKSTKKSTHGKNAGSYSFADDECDATSSDDFPRKFSLRKRLSNSSLSSTGSSTADGNGSKFHSASPG